MAKRNEEAKMDGQYETGNKRKIDTLADAAGPPSKNREFRKK
ncbi:hypothetical protein [Peribacillus kribbensis]|nr:hypothetical protein [Peribacillus kribbensis]